MNIWNKKLMLVLATMAILSTIAFGVPNQQKTFYYSFEEKVYGRLDTSILAVHVPKEMELTRFSTKLSAVKGKSLSEEIPYVKAFKQEGITFVKLDKPADTAKSFQLLSEFREISPTAAVGHPFFVEGERFPLIVTNEFVVRFKPEVDEEWIKKYNRGQEVEVVNKNPHVDRQYLLRIAEKSGLNALEMANRYQESKRVVFSHPDFLIHIEQQYIPGDTNFTRQWHLRNDGSGGMKAGADIDVVNAWDYTRGAPNVIVAVIDGKFKIKHPDLDDNYLKNTAETRNGDDDDGNGYPDDINGWSFADNTDDLFVGLWGGHGQAVAGLVAAEENGTAVVGVCPQCRLLLICIPSKTEDLARAFYYARDRGADIINCCWSSYTASTLPTFVTALDETANGTQGGRGIPIFFAAGNRGKPFVSYPARDPNTIAVGGSDCNDVRYSGSQYGREINILAPTKQSNDSCGLVTTGFYNEINYTFGGTSGATAIAAGTAGLMLSANPNLTRQEVQDILQDTAEKIEPLAAKYDANGFSFTHGYGRINAYEAVKEAKERLPEHRDPVDIVMVLDYSGSMKNSATRGGRNKIEVLKDAVEIFLKTWEAFVHPEDRIGIVYFRSSVNPLTISLQPLVGNVETLIREMRGEEPDGCSAVGGGLQVALDALSSSTDVKHPAILLSADGRPNVNPKVVKMSNHYEIINSTDCWCHDTPSVPEQPGISLKSYGIPIHIIGIGKSAAIRYREVLDGIRTETAGLLHLATNPEEELYRFYLEDLVEALNLGSLEMVDYRHGTPGTGQPMSETFVMDGAVRKAVFLVHWVGNSFPGIKSDAPHNENLQPTRWVKGKFYRIACFDFPYVLNGQPIDPVGNWRIYTGESSQTIPYQTALLVEEN